MFDLLLQRSDRVQMFWFVFPGLVLSLRTTTTHRPLVIDHVQGAPRDDRLPGAARRNRPRGGGARPLGGPPINARGRVKQKG